MERLHLFTQLSSLPSLLVFQPLPVPQLAQELPVFLACLTLQQALGVPVGLALQWLYQQVQLLPRILFPLGPLFLLSLLENHEHPGAHKQLESNNVIFFNILNYVDYTF